MKETISTEAEMNPNELPLVKEIFQRLVPLLANPEALKDVVNSSSNRNPDPHFSISNEDSKRFFLGLPSLVVLFSNLEKLGANTAHITHKYILLIKNKIEQEGISELSFFNGAAGMAFAVHEASLGGTRYKKLLDFIHNIIAENIEKTFIHPLQSDIGNQTIPSHLYDPISGISGIGRYLLEKIDDPLFYMLSQKICRVLVEFSKTIMINSYAVPAWCLAKDTHPNSSLSGLDLKGNFNLGLAHGIAGVLAYLSIAKLKGIEVSGQSESISLIANWLKTRSQKENNAIRWTHSISWEEEVEGLPRKTSFAQDGWCYGVPGIARCLFLAGKALNDAALKSFAMEAFQGIFNRPAIQWLHRDPMLCHGLAGLLLATHLMSREKGGEQFKKEIPRITQLLLEYYRKDAPLGFYDYESIKSGGFAPISKFDLLEGTSGILLTLMLLSNNQLNWHLPLMLHE